MWPVHRVLRCADHTPCIIHGGRAQADGTLMPGVELGEIGPKLNFTSNNIGYCRFTRVRVPMNQYVHVPCAAVSITWRTSLRAQLLLLRHPPAMHISGHTHAILFAEPGCELSCNARTHALMLCVSPAAEGMYIHILAGKPAYLRTATCCACFVYALLSDVALLAACAVSSPSTRKSLLPGSILQRLGA